jgi:hypothetical protein
MDPQEPNRAPRQVSFEFDGNAIDGLALWREQQRAALRRLGMEFGLPIGSLCEVMLKSDIKLRGRLDLDDADLFLSATRKDALLRIGAVSFSIAEVADCVRLD